MDDNAPTRGEAELDLILDRKYAAEREARLAEMRKQDPVLDANLAAWEALGS